MLFFQTHCINMEEINLVESKLSSVEKLLSTKMQRYVGEETMRRIPDDSKKPAPLSLESHVRLFLLDHFATNECKVSDFRL